MEFTQNALPCADSPTLTVLNGQRPPTVAAPDSVTAADSKGQAEAANHGLLREAILGRPRIMASGDAVWVQVQPVDPAVLFLGERPVLR